MISFPNCKINLGLKIIERRSDGFHNIETIFYPLNLTDVLEIIKSKDGIFSFQTGGIKVPEKNDDNLSYPRFFIQRKNSGNEKISRTSTG